LASECVGPGQGAKILPVDIKGTIDKSLRNFIHVHNEQSVDNKIDVIKKRTNTSHQELLDAIKKWAVRKGHILQFKQKVAHVSTLDISA
jgi:predicted RNA-binding protein with RPS1 domain